MFRLKFYCSLEIHQRILFLAGVRLGESSIEVGSSKVLISTKYVVQIIYRPVKVRNGFFEQFQFSLGCPPIIVYLGAQRIEF